MNPILFRVLLLIGIMFNLTKGVAQHLLEYGGEKKIIKVKAERGSVLYYYHWPDTIDGYVRGVLMSDITSLKELTAKEADSLYTQFGLEKKQLEQNNAKEELVKKENRKWVAIELDLNTAMALNRMDVGGGLGIGKKEENGLIIMLRSGLDYTNQGQGFIKTIQIPVGLHINYDMLKTRVMKGIPFIQMLWGYNYVLSGQFDSSRERAEKYVEYKDDLLEGSMFLCVGGGITYNKIRFGLSYKLQGSNVKYPEIGNTHFVMVKIAMKLL